MVKLLVVDDSKFSQILTSNLLKEIGEDIEVIFANDGKEGLEKYKEVQPDYSIIDLLMPTMDGRELIGLIKKHDPAAKLFVLSADVQNSVREDILSLGVIDFINKPLNKDKARSIYNIIKGG